MLKVSSVFLFPLLLAVSSVDAAPTIIFSSKAAFAQAAGTQLQSEDWTTYPPGTLLDGRTIRGVTYDSTSSEELVVGSSHGAGWLIGYARGDGRYASFSSETITFVFGDPVSAFGISLSQGNSSGPNSYNGSSEWQISIDSGLDVYTSVATYSQTDFTGEAYLGLLNLTPSTSFAITRLRSDANIVWDIRDIAWIPTVDVPEPSVPLLVTTGIALIAVTRRRKCTVA